MPPDDDKPLSLPMVGLLLMLAVAIFCLWWNK